jgi:glyoxylase-like metal-dependent hydrolase (beta-lactamase superfamily II)
MRFDTIYALRSKGVILIDGGDPHKIENLKHGLERASIKPQEIKLILLTHGHWDHIGSTKEIQALTGAKVLLHQKDMHFLGEAHISQPPGFTTWGKIIIAMLSLYTSNPHIPTFEVDMVAGDDEISLAEFGIPGRVVHTPGHSWGSVSFLLDGGQAFVGDLAMNMFPMRFSFCRSLAMIFSLSKKAGGSCWI